MYFSLWLHAWSAPPVIVKRPEGVRFNLRETISFSVTAESALPVTYQWFQNKKPIVGATGQTLVIPGAGVEHIGDYSVEVTNADGTVSSLPDNDARAVMKDAFVIEAEDFNFDGGKTLPAASVMPYAGGGFTGKDGLPGIDFHLVSQSSDNPLDNGNFYRNGWSEFGIVMGEPPTAPEPLGNVDIVEETVARNLMRPDYTLSQNYKVGWNDPGEWYQYTREFDPAGIWFFSAVAIVSGEGLKTNRFAAVLELVTGDPTAVGATTTVLGEISGNGTGGWSSYDYLPFQTPGRNEAALFSPGQRATLRYRITEGDHDLDALLFYKVIHGDPPRPCDAEHSLGFPCNWQNVTVDTVAGTITAWPVSGDAGFLQVSGKIIENVRLDGDRLIVRFRQP